MKNMSEQKKVIVSLTSFPAAIPYAKDAIKSILAGNTLPDKVVLYLTFSQFEDSKIPSELTTLANNNPLFEIRNYKEDIRSYRKLIPALKDFPNDIIVTVDDDVRYHKNMLQDLLYIHKKIPNVIIANRAKKIKRNAPYRQWKKYRWYHFLFKKLNFNFKNIQTGVGGVLYPPKSLDQEMMDTDIFKEIAPTTDDIWFWAAAVANGTYILPFPFGKHNKPRGLEKPKNLSLKTTNFKKGTDLNRKAFEKILKKYPVVKNRIEDEKIVVTMTSFPPATQYAAQALESIINGSVLPSKIVLYLTFSQFPNSIIPKVLTDLEKKYSLFEIKNYDSDIKSYRKLIPALIDFPDAVIVTADDDVQYDKNWLKKLLGTHKLFPKAIIAHRVRKIRTGVPYSKWKRYKSFRHLLYGLYPKFSNLQVGIGGVLYPPNCLKKELLEAELFTKIAPTSDDIWFWAAAVANGVKIMPVPFGIVTPNELDKPTEISLHNINMKAISGIDVNLSVFEQVLEKYPIIKKRVKR
jgi:hypothetical protein